MFERTKQMRALDKLEKKSNNSTAVKRVEGVLKTELVQLLEKYLTEMSADSVEIEVREQDVPDFISVLGSDMLAAYDYEQLTETLYRFTVKEIAW